MSDAKNVEDKQNTNGQAANGSTGAMPLFYKKPIPLDAKKHSDLSLKSNFGFGFTADANAVPVNMIEMPQVASFYPIAFSPDENATPVAILGLRDKENLFLDEKKQWDNTLYIPSYIRRYPFIFSEIPNTEQLTLCIDDVEDVIEKSDKNTFFDGEGKPSELANNALEFCKSYHAAAQQTVDFSKALAAADLLIEREAQINIVGNRRINFSGFKIIDEKKFNALDDAVILDWRKKGWLPAIYAHLFSGIQWQRLSRLLNERLQDEAA